MSPNYNYLLIMMSTEITSKQFKVRSIDKFTTEADFYSQLTGMLLQFVLYPSLL